jgi:hypothetical protein
MDTSGARIVLVLPPRARSSEAAIYLDLKTRNSNRVGFGSAHSKRPALHGRNQGLRGVLSSQIPADRLVSSRVGFHSTSGKPSPDIFPYLMKIFTQMCKNILSFTSEHTRVKIALGLSRRRERRRVSSDCRAATGVLGNTSGNSRTRSWSYCSDHDTPKPMRLSQKRTRSICS